MGAIKSGSVENDIAYITEVTKTEHKAELVLTKGTPYITLTGELWGVYREDLEEN